MGAGFSDAKGRGGELSRSGVRGCMMGRKRFEVLREIFRDYDTKREGLISRGAFRKQVLPTEQTTAATLTDPTSATGGEFDAEFDHALRFYV